MKSEMAYALCDELQSAQPLKFQPPFWAYSIHVYYKFQILTLGLN